MVKLLTNEIIDQLRGAYKQASSRLFCLDYDGTLVDFAPTPEQAVPTPEVLAVLAVLARDPANMVAIVSGRDQSTLHDWFGALPVVLSAEHGQFLRLPGGAWHAAEAIDGSWKADVREAIKAATKVLPNSFIEEKETSLCLHFRLSPTSGAKRAVQDMQAKLAGKGLTFLPGSKVLEIRKQATTKAMALRQCVKLTHDFMVIAGDDTTDESMFAAAPPQAITIKVRPGATAATFAVASPAVLLAFFGRLLEQSNE